MPNNQFKRGELYSVINGMASTAVARRLQKHCLSQQELCNRTYRDKPSITRLIDNLEKQKLVKRIASKEDRRINLVCLSETAKSLQDITINLANKTMEEALSGVTKYEIETVKKVLYQVYDNLNK